MAKQKQLKMRELLSSHQKWAKGYAALDNKGHVCTTDEIKACRWCLSGALGRCYGGTKEYKKVENKMEKYCDTVLDFNGDYIAFNDDKNTKFADIKRMLDKLNI